MSTSAPPPASAPPQPSRWSRWGIAGVKKGVAISDWASGYANSVSAKIGGERFWPSSNDMPLELDKCERILRAFTVEGIPQKEEKEEEVPDGKGGILRKKRRVLKKIAIARARGICIYSSMRSGIAPLGGSGGAGIVMARLPDGSWSAPSAVSPNNLSVGLLLGVDFFDVVLLLNSDKAVDGFKTHKFTVGAETAVAAGPVGSGTSIESGMDRAPIYSYVRSRGMYAGVEAIGQVFFDRFDENERFYYHPGIKAGDILSGKVRMPPLAASLHRALRDAEAGVAQGGSLERTVYDVVRIPESEVMKRLGPHARKAASAPAGMSTFAERRSGEESQAGAERRVVAVNGEGAYEGEEDEEDLVREGERLRLPPTPQELEALEQAGIPDEEDLKFEREEREAVYKLPPPPVHHRVETHWKTHPTLAAKRRRTQLTIDGPYEASQRQAQYVPLPPSPVAKDGRRDELLPESGLLGLQNVGWLSHEDDDENEARTPSAQKDDGMLAHAGAETEAHAGAETEAQRLMSGLSLDGEAQAAPARAERQVDEACSPASGLEPSPLISEKALAPPQDAPSSSAAASPAVADAPPRALGEQRRESTVSSSTSRGVSGFESAEQSPQVCNNSTLHYAPLIVEPAGSASPLSAPLPAPARSSAAALASPRLPPLEAFELSARGASLDGAAASSSPRVSPRTSPLASPLSHAATLPASVSSASVASVGGMATPPARPPRGQRPARSAARGTPSAPVTPLASSDTPLPESETHANEQQGQAL